LRAWIAYYTRFDLQELQVMGISNAWTWEMTTVWRHMLLAHFMLHKMAALSSEAYTEFYL
jgi:hypothetical protein